MALVAVVGAILTALALFSVRWLRAAEPVLRILFYYFCLSTLIFLPLAIQDWKLPTTPLGWGALVGIGVCMTLAQLFITIAYRHASAIKLSPYIYTVIVFTALMDWGIWGKMPDVLECAGIALVIVGGVIALLRINPHKKDSEHL